MRRDSIDSVLEIEGRLRGPRHICDGSQETLGLCRGHILGSKWHLLAIFRHQGEIECGLCCHIMAFEEDSSDWVGLLTCHPTFSLRLLA